MAMYPSMDQDYVSTNVLEAIEEAWDWEEQTAKEDKDGEEWEELRVGKDGWWLGRKGEEPQADSWSKREVKEMVQWVLNNGYVKQGGVVYKQKKGFGMGLKCAVFLANLACYGTEKRFAEEEGRRPEQVEHNYRFVDDMFSLTGVVPGEEAYKLKRTVRRAADGGHLVFLGADLWWREDEKGRIKFETGVHWREKDYPIKIRRYPVRDSMILDAQRLGVLTGQYIRALRLCSVLRLLKEAIQTITKTATQRGYGTHEQKKQWGKFLRVWWGGQDITMGEMHVWFGRMQRWVRKEISKEERRKKRCWYGWRCRRKSCPFEPVPPPPKVWTPPEGGLEPQRREAKNPHSQGVRTTEIVGEEEEMKSRGVWRETVVVVDLREPPLVAPTQSDNRKVGCAETTEAASTNKSLTNDVERQQKEEQAKQQERESQDDKGTKEVEDGDTDSDVSILTWLQGLKTRGEGGQMEGHKDVRPEVVDDEATVEQQRQERKSHTEDHGGPRPSPQVGLEVGEKEEKEEDHKQKEKSEIQSHKDQYPLQRQEDEQQGEESGGHGEDSDTNSDISILRWLQGLRKEEAGGQSQENPELDVVEEEETKKQPRQEERRNAPGQGEPEPSRAVAVDGVEKGVLDEQPGPKTTKNKDRSKVQHPTGVGNHGLKEAEERGPTEEKVTSEEAKSRRTKPQPRKGEWQVELPKDILETWNQAVREAASQGKETMGLLWGTRTENGVKVGGLHIPRHDVQTSHHCAVGDEALTEAVSWGASLGGKLVGWIHTHPGHVPVLSALDVCTLNTIGQTLWSIIPEGGPAVGVVQSWTSPADEVACAPMKGGLKAYTMSVLGMEVANRCAAIRRKKPGMDHRYHEHLAGVWDDDDPHPVGREQEEVPVVLVEAEDGGCMDMGNNRWWTKWLGAGSTPKEKENTKPDNNEESDSSTSSNGIASTVGLEAWSQKRGPKHACGLCCRPLRAKEGAVRCSQGHWMHLKCAGVTVSQAKKVFRSNRVFQCRCRKARPAKWLREERERHKQRRREQRNKARKAGVAPEEQLPKPQARAEPQQSDSERPEVVGVDGHRIVLGGRVALTGMKKKMELEGKAGEVESIIEEQGKVRLRKDCGRRVLVSLDRVRVQEVEHMGGAEDSKAAQQQRHGEETKGRGVAGDNEPHGRKEDRSEEEEMGGQEETFELWNGVRLVGMRQPELEGHKGVLEEIYKDKVQVLLVGGMRRVKVDKKKVVPEVVEPVEVLPPGFEGWSFLEQIGVGSAPTMDEVKAAYKKWVLRLHPDKNMNNIAKATHLFKRLTSGYEGWKSAPGVTPPRPAEEPPNYQSNPTYFRSNFCNTTSSAGQTAPEEAPPSAKNPETEGDGEGFWCFLWGSKRPGRSEHASGMGASHGEGTPKGAPPPGSGTQRTQRLLFHEKFRWHTHHVRAIQADRILAEKRRRGSLRPPRGRKQHVLIGTRPGVQSASASLNGMGAGGETLGAGGVHHRGGHQLHSGGHNQVDAQLAQGKRDCRASRHPAVQGVEDGSQVRSGQAPPAGDKRAWKRTVAQFRRRQGDGVQLVQRSAEHKGATRNAPWHGLGLEARGTETGRQATQEPKGRATRRRVKKEEQ